MVLDSPMRRIAALSLALVMILTACASCSWYSPFGSTPFVLGRPAVASVGAGAAIVIYEARKSGDLRDVYVQKIDSGGMPLWGKRGKLVASGYKNWGSDGDLFAVGDGEGGAIVSWGVYPSRPDPNKPREEQLVYQVAKIDSSGNITWKTGVYKCNRVISDGEGGAFLRSVVPSDPSTVRIDSRGGLLWDKDTMPLSDGSCDGKGGLVFVGEVDTSTRVQRLDGDGNLLWGQSGLPLTQSRALMPQIASDGSGGGTVVWMNMVQSGGRDVGSDIYAQKIDQKGNILWQAGGIPVYLGKYAPANPRIAADNQGGVYIVFSDGPSRLYVQKVEASGKLTWLQTLSSGVPSWNVAIGDGSGGVIIDWTGAGEERVERIGKDGNKIWGDNGVAVVSGSKMRSASVISRDGNLSCVSGDGNGGVLLAWCQGADSYVQRIDSSGKVSWGSSGIRLNQ